AARRVDQQLGEAGESVRAELAVEGDGIRTCGARADGGRDEEKARAERDAGEHADRARGLVAGPRSREQQDEPREREDDLGNDQSEGSGEVHQCAPSCASATARAASPITRRASPSGAARATRALSAAMSARIGARKLSG